MTPFFLVLRVLGVIVIIAGAVYVIFRLLKGTPVKPAPPKSDVNEFVKDASEKKSSFLKRESDKAHEADQNIEKLNNL